MKHLLSNYLFEEIICLISSIDLPVAFFKTIMYNADINRKCDEEKE